MFIEIVNADCECVYEATIPPSDSFSSSEIIEGKITIKSDTKDIVSDNFLGYDYVSILDSTLDSNWTNQKLIELFEQKCPSKITACYGEQVHIPGGSYATITAIILNNTLTSKINNYPHYFSNGGKSYYILEESDCQIGSLNIEKSTCGKIDIEYPCDFVETRLDDMQDLYCKTGTEGCISSSISKYNIKKEEISDYCNQILKYQGYENDCVMSCINVQERINAIEGIDNQQACGFSSKLLLFIGNIVKWLKYIVPVIVIVLGILDFIKAIAADKDDEMKKAQKRFIIRLVAAALIFIIPFIIEFVLDIMGFDKYIDGCGIFDL